MLTRQQAQGILERALKFSTFPECRLTLEETQTTWVRFANNHITTSGSTRTVELSISSTRDRRTGVAQTSSLEDAELRAAVERSEAMAALAPPNDEYVEPVGPQTYGAFEHWDEETAAAGSNRLVSEVGKVVSHAVRQQVLAAGLFQRWANVRAAANKAGNFGYERWTDARLSTTARMADGSSSGWASQPSIRIQAIDGAQLARIAAEKCLRWRKPVRLEPGKYTVVLEPTAAADLLHLVAYALDARASEEGRTPFSRKGGGTLLGEKLFPEFITLRTDPADSRFPAPHWAEGGEPVRAISWIEKGVLKNLAFSRFWARQRKATPSFPVALVLDGSTASAADLVKRVQRGLLVTRFWYVRFVNPRTLQYTGLTRDGLFLIEDGEIRQAVLNLRFNESPVRVLQNAEALSVAQRAQGAEGAGMITPAILSHHFEFSSISDAV
jgi:predicted Zn-dependent protease